jgi:hypothetical protein
MERTFHQRASSIGNESAMFDRCRSILVVLSFGSLIAIGTSAAWQAAPALAVAGPGRQPQAVHRVDPAAGGSATPETPDCASGEAAPDDPTKRVLVPIVEPLIRQWHVDESNAALVICPAIL